MERLIDSLFKLNLPAGELAVRGLAVFLFVVVLLRISGKRQLGQMSAPEFVAILLISNAVQNAMNGGDNSLAGGLILACVIVAASHAISILTFRSKRYRNIFEGTPRLLIKDGKPLPMNLKHELISEGELRTLLRKQGIHRVSDVKEAMLESDGTLTIDHYEGVAVQTAPQTPR